MFRGLEFGCEGVDFECSFDALDALDGLDDFDDLDDMDEIGSSSDDVSLCRFFLFFVD